MCEPNSLLGVVSVPDPNQPQRGSHPVSRAGYWKRSTLGYWFESGAETMPGVAWGLHEWTLSPLLFSTTRIMLALVGNLYTEFI